MRYFVVVAVLAVGLLAFGGISREVREERESTTCGARFMELDADGKGYLDFLEFRKGWRGPLGYGNIGPYGNVRSAFQSADDDGDGRLSAGEYCTWKAHS